MRHHVAAVIAIGVIACGKSGGGRGGGDLALDRIAAIAVPGYTVKVVNQMSDQVTLSLDGKARALVTIGRCILCQVTDDTTRPRVIDSARMMMSSGVAHDPATTVEGGALDAGGKPAQYAYVVGFYTQGGTTIREHKLRVVLDDGKHQLTADISDAAMPSAESADDFKAKVQRGPLEAAAKELLAAYAPSL